MPFTLSHPAAIAVLWPLVRRERLPIAALAIGAMSPDFEFFLHLRPVALWSHTLVGLVAFCLPVGIAVFAVWQFIAREPVRELLGCSAEPRRDYMQWTWWIRVAVGVLLGAGTHLLWDGITHGNYWGAHLWPGLRTTALTWGTLSVPWFNLMQHLSTIGGGLVVVSWLYAILRAQGRIQAVFRRGWRRRALATIVIIAVLAGMLNGALGPFGADFWTAQRLLGRMAVGAMLGGAVAVLGFALQRRSVPRSAGAI